MSEERKDLIYELEIVEGSFSISSTIINSREYNVLTNGHQGNLTSMLTELDILDLRDKFSLHKIIPVFVFWKNCGHHKLLSRFINL